MGKCRDEGGIALGQHGALSANDTTRITTINILLLYATQKKNRTFQQTAPNALRDLITRITDTGRHSLLIDKSVDSERRKRRQSDCITTLYQNKSYYHHWSPAQW